MLVSPSSFRLGFAHPTLTFPFPSGLLGGSPGWGSSSFHHLQLHPVPTSQDLLRETRHLQGLRARGGLGRARGPAAAVGGAALPTEPAKGDVREGLAQTSPQDKRGAGEHSASVPEPVLGQCLASPLSPFISASSFEELKLALLLGRCTGMVQPTSSCPALPMANSCLMLGGYAIKSKPPGTRTLRSDPPLAPSMSPW